MTSHRVAFAVRGEYTLERWRTRVSVSVQPAAPPSGCQWSTRENREPVPRGRVIPTPRGGYEGSNGLHQSQDLLQWSTLFPIRDCRQLLPPM